MASNNFRLESGQEYSLQQLFNGKNRIVIPDLQRDYCWGDKAWNKDANSYTELVSGFIENLISFFKEKPNEKLTLGLIYGYENPHFHIQLCDGQQRLTTLFLLLGMINRRTENNYFKNLLITEAEQEDDKEPNLLYAIRESTLYFLSDLVCEFFIKKDLKIEDITKQNWFFNEYKLDASIQSMLSAIKIIDGKIKVVDCKSFGEFLIKNLQMIYYDMGHRARGEETFVIINTTGEPLTATENLKPILIGNIRDEKAREKASNEWEDREEWFWQNKRENEQTSDDALNDFFVWYWQIRLLQEKSWKDKKSYTLNPTELFQKKTIALDEQEEYSEIKNWDESKNLDTVHKYFIALKLLIEKSNDDEIAKVLKTILNEKITLSWFRSSKVNLDVILPLIAYVEKFKYKNLYQFARRIRRNYYDSLWNERKTNYIDWRHILRIIELSETEEEVLKFETLTRINDFAKISNVTLNEWYNYDEKQKDILRVNHRLEIEQWENHPELNGDLSILWKANDDNLLDFDKISKLYLLFKELSDCFIEKKSKDNPIISNYFRMYKLLLGYPKIGHIDYCSWDMEGAWFSWRDTKSNDFIKYLYDERIISLIKTPSTNLITELENRIITIVQETSLLEINEDTFIAANHLKAWLLIKVLYSNSKSKLLSYYDGNGIASYTDFKRNMLNANLKFSLANSICGYAIKNPANRISYANKDIWGKVNYIDTIIGESISYSEFINRNKEPITENKIECINVQINNLITSFINKQKTIY